jgi:hypothetical protein
VSTENDDREEAEALRTARERAAARKRRIGYYFPPAQIITMFALVIGLIAVVTMKDSCAHGAENLYKAFELPDGGPGPGDDGGSGGRGGGVMPKP